MPDQTTELGIPYPLGTDPPSGPTQMKAIAERVEEQMLAQVRSSGVSDIAAAQSTSSYPDLVALGTPDRVSDVMLPADGLIHVGYRALWKTAGGITDSSARASIFLNGTELYAPRRIGAAAIIGAISRGGAIPNTQTTYTPLYSNGGGLCGHVLGGSGTPQDASYAPVQILGGEYDETVAEVRGGMMTIEAPAGTYTVEIRYVAPNEGSLTVKERKLWVWSMPFGFPVA